MHIALVSHKVDFQDGQGRVNYEIAHALLRQGHRVTVIAEFCSPDIAQHPHGRFVCMRNHPLPTQLARNLYFAIRSGRWLRRHRKEFDLVQANGFVMWEPADVVAVHYVHRAWLDSPYFPFRWSSLSPYAYYQRLLTLMNARYERQAFLNARLLIAVSQSTANEVIALGVPREKLRVVPNGVALEEFHPGPGDRARFGLPEAVPLALFAGDIRTPRKNLETALRALQQVPKLHLAVAGKLDGSPYPALAAELGIVDRVHFLGLTSEIALLMRSVDLFVIPSRYESYGMVVLEAMATGLPVILSSRVGAVEVARDVSLVLEDPDDVERLRVCFQQLIDEPETAREIAERGRARALQFQWSSTSEGYLAVYRELLPSGDSAKVASGRSNVER